MKQRILIFAALLSLCTVTANAQEAEKIPFEGIDMTWQNGSDRRDSSVLKTKYFTPSIMIDVNYNYGFNNPIDNTVVGSTVIARHNEVQLSSANLGGDFYYEGARARIMTQFGTRSTVIPRNDVSPDRGQYNLADVYRYLSEAYVGYHFNKWYGVNVDAGMFMSYLGLNSYYQCENWEYQASFTSDNTPWYFNGLRVQIHPTKTLKVEAWLINGWQSYGKYNSLPGFGGNITYAPNSNFKILTNDYLGTDAANNPDRMRFHSDNSVQYRYLNRPQSKGVTQMAFSLTGDIGFESGGGVKAFNGNATTPTQNFMSLMFYNRTWFNKGKIAWTIGGGMMTNPGRYLVLYPTGQASPLPSHNDPTKTEGAYPFETSPGTQFKGWDASTNIDFMPNKSFTFRIEYVIRNANVPYFAGRGGVTSQDGLTTTILSNDWRPDLVKKEQRLILALLFRL